MKDLEEPYYLKMISLTNHFPFDLPEEKASIDKFDSNSTTLNQYFQTVRYFDESLEVLFNELKDAGMYEDSIIVIMGDHYGISSYHNKAMAQFLGKEEITPYDEVQLERVPLFIHIPGNKDNQVISKVTGQIDFKPTILNMLDIENQNDIVLVMIYFLMNERASLLCEMVQWSVKSIFIQVIHVMNVLAVI